MVMTMMMMTKAISLNGSQYEKQCGSVSCRVVVLTPQLDLFGDK